MDKNQKFNSYNQIIKEFDVYIMQVGKDTYQFKLVKRLDGDKPPRLTLETLDKKIDKLAEIVQDGFNKINNRLDAIVKANNLVDPTTQK